MLDTKVVFLYTHTFRYFQPNSLFLFVLVKTSFPHASSKATYQFWKFTLYV